MEKNNEKEFKQTRLTIVLVAIIVVLVFALGFVIGTNNNIKNEIKNGQQVELPEEKEVTEGEEEEEPEEEPEEEIEEEFEEVSLNSHFLDDVPRIPEYLCGGVMFPLNKKDVYLKDLSINQKLNLLISGYDNQIKVEGNPDYKPLILDDEDIEKYFADTSFLNDIKKNGFDSGEANNSYEVAEPISMEFKNNKLYVSKYPTGCEGPMKDGYQVKLINAKKNSKELVMTYKVYYLKSYYNEKTDDFTNEIFVSKNDTRSKYKNVDYDEFENLDYSDFDSYTMHFDITNKNIRFEKMIYNEA